MKTALEKSRERCYKLGFNISNDSIDFIIDITREEILKDFAKKVEKIGNGSIFFSELKQLKKEEGIE